ncbi:MAG: cell division protein FtsQ [Paludibacter sp.]|nr:cell division protein FtsQ [Paludibacter sp.]
MKPIWKYILITFFALLVLGYVGFSIWYFSGREKENVCRKLEIILADSANIQLVTQTDIAKILEDNDLNPLGKTIKYISTESIEEVLHKNPMLKAVECYKTPSGIVNVRILQRCPKFRVVGFKSYYIDVDRKPLPVSANYAAYVPVVSGRVTYSFATGKLFDFVSFIADNPFWNAQIEQIYVCNDLKIELVPRVGDAIIVLGSLENYEAKLEKLHQLYVKGFNILGWNKYKVIDLEYENQVVCSKISQQAERTQLINEKKDSIIASKL